MPRGLLLAALAPVLLLPAAAVAQTRERVKVSNVRLGLPLTAGNVAGIRGYKAAQWTPVYVDLECVRDTEEALLLVVETRDADDSLTEGVVEIAPMLKGDRRNGNELGRIPYLKPGGSYSGAGVTVRIKGAETGRTYGEMSERSFTGLEPAAYLVVGIGTNLNGIRFPAEGKGDDNSPTSRNGWVYTAQVLDVGTLPDQWIGYGAADLLVLGTGADRGFWEALAAPQHEKRRQAIVEWVRRGGRLVLSVGTNPDVLEPLKEFRDMLPAAVPPGGKRMVQSLPFVWHAPGTLSDRNGLVGTPGGPEFPVNALDPKPDRPTFNLLTEDAAAGRPLAVQGPYGLGRVTVFGLDLDRPPVADWGRRAGFWENVVNQTGYLLPSLGQPRERNSSRSDEFSGALQGSLDFFEGVPVVSFGWVALFILIYIILIGPVDYLFLKKVVRRLEWTWVTFPLIVVTVSAGAYYAAYALKGKDLKINKVDVVDVDLAGRRVDGNTWFTLFSPRIQNYTIGLEPAGPVDGSPGVWTPAAPAEAARNTVLSWQGHVDRYGGGSGGLFSKRYRYQSIIDPTDPNRDLYASGLESVPIQVWTSKAFHGQWAARLDPARPPVSGELRVNPTAPTVLVGRLTNHLPVDQFTDAALFYRGRAFVLPREWPTGLDRPISVSAEPGRDTAEDLKNWLTDRHRYPDGVLPWTPQPQQSGYGTNVGTTTNPNFRLWPVLFADVAAESMRATTPNASLRKLDQSWRVASDRPEQAVLVLRLATREGPAEEMTRAPESPTRLWLGDLPTSGNPRPEVQGTLKQETYVRVLIPVALPPAKK